MATEHIQTIPVARKAQPTNGEVNGTVAGWGYLSNTEAHLSRQLKVRTQDARLVRESPVTIKFSASKCCKHQPRPGL